MPTKILLIDDEEAICRFTKRNLERTGRYEVTVAYSGEEGLAKAREAAFDLVITDFRMPGIDGKAVLDTLKASDANAPVVIFSIYHDDESTLTQQIRQKADGVISKPIDHAQLYETIEQALKRSSGPRAG